MQVILPRAWYVLPDAIPGEPEDDEGDPRVFPGDILDPRGRCHALEGNVAPRRYKIDTPPVFEANGTHVHPPPYGAAISEAILLLFTVP